MKPRKILQILSKNKMKNLFQCKMAPFLCLLILVNLVVTANGVCLWQNGKLECQFHQSEVLQSGQSGASAAASPSDSANPSSSSGSGGARSDTARLLWSSSGGNNHQNQRYHQNSQPRSPLSPPKPKVVRISQHRPSPTQPSSSSPFSHRFLPFIDTEDEDLVSVSKVQVHEPSDAQSPQLESQSQVVGQYSQYQQQESQSAYQSYPQEQAQASIDGMDYGGGLSPIEVSHIAWSVGSDGRTDPHGHDGYTQSHDHDHDAQAPPPPPPPRRHDSEIEEIHSILPSLLDPVRIKKLIYPKGKHGRLHAQPQKYGRSFDGHSHDQEQQQPLNLGQGEHGVGPVEPEAIPSHNVYESSYTQMESHDHISDSNQNPSPNRGNPHLQNSKTLSSPLLLHGAAMKKKQKPFRIQILDGKQEHQKPGTGSSSAYGPFNKKSTLLVPATKAYHEQYNVPYKMNTENEHQMYAGEYSHSHAVSGLDGTPTQLVPMNHNVHFTEQDHHHQEQEMQPQLQYQHSENLNAPSPTPIYSSGPIVVHEEHQEAELKPIDTHNFAQQQQSHQYTHAEEGMPPPLPQPLAYHAPFPGAEDQTMAESVNAGHGSHGQGHGQGFYHQQQYLSATPAPFAPDYVHGGNPNPSPSPYPPQPQNSQPQQPPQGNGYNQYAPAPASYYPVNYHAPAPGPAAPWSYNGQQPYNGYPYPHPHPHPYVHPHAYSTGTGAGAVPAPTSPTTTAAPVPNEKESVLNALKTLSQSKPDLIKDVVSQHKHEGLGDDVVEFVSSQKENSESDGDSAATNQTGTHFYMKKGKGSKNKITVDASSVENPDPKLSMPIDQVLSLLLSNQKYSSSGKNYFKNSFTQEIESGTKNHPNELAKVLYDMGILQRIATGTLTMEQMELVNKLIDLNHQEQELEEEIEFYMDRNGKMRKKKPAKYIVPRTASRGSGEREQQRRSQSQSSYSAYDDKREEYEKRRRRPQSYQSPSYTYDRYGYERSRDRDGDRQRERGRDSDRHPYEDRHQHRERERDMLLSPGHSGERRYNEQRRQPAQSTAPAPNFQAPSQVTESQSPVNLNIIIPTDEPPKPQKSLNDAIPSDTLNLITAVELGHGQGHGINQPQYQQTGYSQFTQGLPIPPLPIPPVFPQLASVFKNHPFLQRMKDEWWKGVGSMLNDIQRTQLYNHFGVDPGYNLTASAYPLEVQQSQMQTDATGVEHHHHYQGHRNGLQNKSVMVQLLSAIGLLSSFMLLAFIGIQMQKGSGILSGILPKRVHFRSPIQFINPNKLPAVKGKPAMHGSRHCPSKGHKNGHGQDQHHDGSSNSQEILTQSMEKLREKVLSGEQPYNLHIHVKGNDLMTSAEKKKQQHGAEGEGIEGMEGMDIIDPSKHPMEEHGHDEDSEDDNSDYDDDQEEIQLGPSNDDDDHDSSGDTDEVDHDRPSRLRTTAATAPASDPVPAAPTTRIPFDESFESYLKQAAKIKLVNNPELLVRQFVKPGTTPAAPTIVPVYRRPSPPTTAATSSTTTMSTSTTTTTTTTTTPAPRTSPPAPQRQPVFIAPAMHTEEPSTTASTTTTTTTTAQGPQELIESEETIITNTIVPNAEDDRAAETTPTSRS